MNIKTISAPLVAAALLIGAAGTASAQYSAPFPTGSAGNSNTGPTAQFGGHTGVLGSRGPSAYYGDIETSGPVVAVPARVRAYDPTYSRPFPTGSAGNSNTGPGARPTW